MDRKASCSCGQLSIVVKGDPEQVFTCNCFECQKRTGSVFGVSSYFDDEQIVKITGKSKSYQANLDNNKKVIRNFCKNCGSTVYWKTGTLNNKTGIAVGCFSDIKFPEPQGTIWTTSKHNWVCYPDKWISLETQRN